MSSLIRALLLAMGFGAALFAGWVILRNLSPNPENAPSPDGQGASHALDVGRFLPALPLAERPAQVVESTLVDPPALIFVDSPTNQRAAVRINGRDVGHSPYMGQIRCEPSERVVVERSYPDGTKDTTSVPCSEEIRVIP